MLIMVMSMKKAALVTLLLLAVIFIIPLFLAGSSRAEKPGDATLDQVLETGFVSGTDASISRILEGKTADSDITVRVLMGGDVKELALDDYLFGVVAAEMPASFEPEALKAQAVAARTYTLYQLQIGGAHENADVCTDSTCCSAYSSPEELEIKWGEDAGEYAQKIWNAVSGTSGEVLFYDGKLIDAVFHSSSSEETQSALEVWGSDVAYLQCVPTYGEEESTRFYGQAVFTQDDFKSLFLDAFPQADFSGPAEDWLGNIAYNDAGAVDSCRIGDVAVSGVTVRRLFSLQSTRFDYMVDNGNIILSTEGYGHGVGMSQYGANAMAKDSYDYIDILTHYYTGVQVSQIEGQAD